MSLLGWFHVVRVDLLSSSEHWAAVMAEADALESEHEGCAVEAAERREQAARGGQARALFRDVGYVLKAREETRAEALGGPERRFGVHG